MNNRYPPQSRRWSGRDGSNPAAHAHGLLSIPDLDRDAAFAGIYPIYDRI
ncbi:hypothetical protein HMPREF9603_01911 [Cutibacterium acnes HL001PA1]|nr:hypothetical protein HMPREF9603_01911 [Cutibacterium acnes HL001PA1]EFT09899.1 hypothetical protein HMPREF9619_01755 [Cutibacterium acnes HL082PA2]EFT77179.1 hypothetical protein HMPREF9599_01604 [Cutibacterium acnes HL050PA2]